MDWSTFVLAQTLAVFSPPHAQPQVQSVHIPDRPAVPVCDWLECKEPVDHENEHPSEEQGTLLYGVGASGVFTNVAAQNVWQHNDYTSVTSSEFFPSPFVSTHPKTDLTLRVQPQGQHSLRQAISRRNVGSRTGR